MRNKAFTLIEILAATSIILLLAGLVFFGSRYALESSREKQTRATLTLLSSMLKEANSKGSRDKIESVYRFQYATANNTPKTLPALASVLSSVPPNTLYNWDALVTTQKVMGVLRGVPANAAKLDAVSPDQRLRPDASGAAPTRMSFLGAWGSNANFTPGVLLDAWGNPILYLPAEFNFTNNAGNPVRMMPGISDVLLTSHGTTELHRISSVGFNEQGDELGNTPPRQGSVGFFASAGPDGNFQTGDDNIYSFEN